MSKQEYELWDQIDAMYKAFKALPKAYREVLYHRCGGVIEAQRVNGGAVKAATKPRKPRKAKPALGAHPLAPAAKLAEAALGDKE